jgi:16S rRNA (cytosine1402-N4)-methyltransferase
MYHEPVMPAECIEGLAIRPGGIYVDLTLGGGGHSRLILQQLGKQGKLVAFDQDTDAGSNIPDDARFLFIDQNFRYLKNYLSYYKLIPVDGILADLGISSHHIDDPGRGFSTRFNGPLDMRMNQRQETSAADIVNTYKEERLYNLFREYGEITNARQLASLIVTKRNPPVTTVEGLKTLIHPCIPVKTENKYLAQVFQALRIEVNDELGSLRTMLKQVPEVLRQGGRLVVLSYHSLEDRLVKNFMRSGNFEGELMKDFYGNVLAPLIPVNRKAIVPGEKELGMNPRSRSAKLRIAVKV